MQKKPFMRLCAYGIRVWADAGSMAGIGFCLLLYRNGNHFLGFLVFEQKIIGINLSCPAYSLTQWGIRSDLHGIAIQ